MGESNVHELQEAIRALHAEIEKLASHAATSYVPRAPIGVERTRDGQNMEMLMFYDADHIKVFTCGGGVFISGIEHFGYWPDWFALPNKQARLVAQALLSAAGHPPTAGDHKDLEERADG